MAHLVAWKEIGKKNTELYKGLDVPSSIPLFTQGFSSYPFRWWKSSGCLWTSHQPSLQSINFILLTLKHFFNIFNNNKRVDGGLRWYVYIYWGRHTPACTQAYLPQLFNTWVTGPCNPHSSSKLKATLSTTCGSKYHDSMKGQ